MRIILPESKRGPNDNGDLSNIITIEKEVKKMRECNILKSHVMVFSA